MQDPEGPCLSRLTGRQSIVVVLAAAGVGPSARCIGMVRGGRVAVNGRVIKDPQERADPFFDRITLDAYPIPTGHACRYLVLNKPYGVLSDFADPEGRSTLADFVEVPGLTTVGRLDFDSEGLLLLTNDGWLVHRLGHPRYHHPKTYWAQVEGLPEAESMESLRRGVIIKGRRTAPAEVDLLPSIPVLPPRPIPIRKGGAAPTAWLVIVLTEGQKRQVRHMTAAVGHPTLRLVRVGVGPLQLGDLEPGQWRDLTQQELDALRTALWASARPG